MLQKERKNRSATPGSPVKPKLYKVPKRAVTLAELAVRLGTTRDDLLRLMADGTVNVNPRKNARGEFVFTLADELKFKRHRLVSQLPDWCNVYEGLSDEEIAEVEAIALDRSRFIRPPND